MHSLLAGFSQTDDIYASCTKVKNQNIIRTVWGVLKGNPDHSQAGPLNTEK